VVIQGSRLPLAKDPSFTKWGMVTIDPHALLPGNTQQWNVGVQREIAKNTKVEVSVIGSHSYHLQSGFLAGNQPKPADFQALIARGGPGALWPW